jgi:hypothetical protein
MAEKTQPVPDTMPKTQRCYIGPLQAHTYNYEGNECIWCGPNQLAWMEGRWVPSKDGTTQAWSANIPLTRSKT